MSTLEAQSAAPEHLVHPSFHEPLSTCSSGITEGETGWEPSLSASEDLRRQHLGPDLEKDRTGVC